MKRYFTKYIPVEGEVKEGDICYFTQFKEFGTAKMISGELCFVSFPQEGKGSLTSPISRNLDDKRPYKLFLCSRDIQVGDDIQHTSGENGVCDEIIGDALHFSGDIEGHYSSINQWFKVIGEISSDAVWVSEGIEFDEDEIQPTTHIYGWEDEEGVENQFKKFIEKDKRYISHNVLNRDKYKDAPPEIDFSVKMQPYQIKCPTCKTYH